MAGWFRKLFPRAAGTRPAARRSLRPRLEALEDRLAPATFIVNTLDDTPVANVNLTGYPEGGRGHKLFRGMNIGGSIMPEQEATGQTRKRYKTDLTDAQWALLKDLIPPAVAKTGRKPTDLREVVNTILYQNRTSCQWDMLPHDLTAKSTAFGYYTLWQANGVWERLLDSLRGKLRLATPRVVTKPAETPQDEASPPQVSPLEGQAAQATRIESKRDETPSFVIMDSQSAKTTEVGGEQRGYDGGKKVKGRKRHIAVDSLGLLVAVVVTAANVSDGQGACKLLERMPAEKFPRLKGACGDGRYNDKKFLARLGQRQMTLEVKSRPPGAKGFVLLKKRWIVERTFAWLGFNRRLSKDYERRVASSEARVRIAAIGMMLKRLGNIPQAA